MRALVCDFCGAATPTWECPARDFDFGFQDRAGRWTGSKGGWLACQPCARLVRDGKRDKVERRSLRALERRRPDLTKHERRVVVAALTEIQGDFWTNREGRPRLLTADELAFLAEQPPIEYEERDSPPARRARWVDLIREARGT